MITIEKLEIENRLTLKRTLYKLSQSRSCYLPKRITMIKKIQFSEPDILGFEVDGRVSEAAFVNMMQELIPKIDSPGNIKLYIEIPRYEGTDWEVIWGSLKFAFAKLKTYFEKVDKIALVTDKTWLRFAATVEYSLIPAIKEKSFEFSEKEDALKWIRE